MSVGTPSIACIGVIGRDNNPLHISLFPPEERDHLEMTFLLSSSIDIFEVRTKAKTTDQDLGLLQAIDERLAMYGWITNTGTKFVIIVDMEGRPPAATGSNITSLTGLKDSDLKPAFRALQSAYIGLLRNPFHNPDRQVSLTYEPQSGAASVQSTSRRFVNEIERIGVTWAPSVGKM